MLVAGLGRRPLLASAARPGCGGMRCGRPAPFASPIAAIIPPPLAFCGPAYVGVVMILRMSVKHRTAVRRTVIIRVHFRITPVSDTGLEKRKSAGCGSGE